MANKVSKILVLLVILSLSLPFSVSAQPISSVTAATTITILHTNDFHGQLEASGSNPGSARVSQVINNVRTAVGASNVLLVDGGDIMQGSLLSNLQKGLPTIDVYKAMGYNVATFGNHEFDWGQTTLADRVTQASSVFPFVSANIVSGTCDDTNWTSPAFAQPYVIKTVGTAPNEVKVGFIGVTTTETPIITLASSTAGLCFKDPAASIIHYYDEVKAAADVVVVISHNGYTDGGYGYGLPVYGDQTLAQKLIDAGKAVPLIIGGHSHTNVTTPAVIGPTTVVQAYYNGRRVGRADITVNPDGTTAVAWQTLTVAADGAEDATIKALIATYTSDPAYQTLINQEIGWTNVPIARNYDGDSLMGAFVDDAIYNDLNTDADATNDVDMVFNNPGGLRADISCASYPCLLTYGTMFTILPFGNQTVVGKMTGARIMELLNQSALLSKGSIQVAGIRFKFYNYKGGTPEKTYAWGAFDACVVNRTTGDCDPLEMTKTYNVGTNEFLAPAGQDNFTAFKYMTGITYWGDMLNSVNRWVSATYTAANPYNGALDGRITRDGNAAGGTIVPITILHHNDMHGNLLKGTYVGYTQLATLINQERAYNPTRTLLLNSGDNIQGDAMSYYFKSAPLGYASDGTALPAGLQTAPVIAAMNAMGYDAMTLGNHEFNFGKDIFTGVLKQANFPILQANVTDDGQYGLSTVPVQPYVEKTIGAEGIKVAILGIGNHRIPNYELPSNIPGLTFTNPLTKAQELSDVLRPADDVVIALTHIGFTPDPKSVEVDNNVDTVMAAQVSGLDVIIGGHSHTNPATGYGDYKFLPTIVGGPNNTPVMINQAYRYNNTLGEVIIGVRPKTGGGYEVVSRAGQYISVTSSVAEDATIKGIVDPYAALLATYNTQVLGQTTEPIDALQAFTQETNGANLQADAAVYELTKNGIAPDFHLSGAMTNKKIAASATAATPYTLTVADMFTAMPYENSLVVLNMNGPQLKQVLERAYRNYYYYKYVSGYGGYSYYTTCMIDINAGGQITYNDIPSQLPNGKNVVSLVVNGTPIDFDDASTYYRVSTVNYLAAGSCNFNDSGVSLWPLNQIANDTQYYVRDAVIDYVKAQGTVSPVIEGRLSFIADATGPVITINAPTAKVYGPADTLVLDFSATDDNTGLKSLTADIDGITVTNGFEVPLTALTQGNHILTVKAVDNAYNETTSAVTFQYDSVGPVITINAPVADKIYTASDTLVLDFSAADAFSGVKSVTGFLDGKPVTTGQVINLNKLFQGKHVLKVFAEDNLGNRSKATVNFKYDSQAPIIGIFSPRARTYLHTEGLYISYYAWDFVSGVKSVEATLDSNPFYNGQYVDLLQLDLGTHTFIVTAVDNAGNTAISTVDFTVGASVPSLSSTVKRFYAQRKIYDRKTLYSLLSKLEKAQKDARRGSKYVTKDLQAFIKVVNANSGSHIDPDAANLLVTDAQWVIDHLPSRR